MNRLLGTLFALATFVAIAFAILNIGNYSSMCSAPDVEPTDVVEEQLTIVETEQIVEEETAYEELAPVDSLSNETAPEPVE